MAINFPNSPSDGDIFGNYTYDTSIPGWRKVPENSASLPAGTIVQWPTTTAPANWLICDGSAVSRTEYASLFAAIGVQYGAGNGTTTFNLPDLRGRVVVGRDSGQTEFDLLGEIGGSKTHTLTSSEMPSHTHTFSGTTGDGGSHSHTISVTGGAHTHNLPMGASGAPNGVNDTPLRSSGGPDGNFRTGFESSGSNYGSSTGTHTHSASASTAAAHTHSYSGTTGSAGSGSAHNNLQPYIVLNYIIKTSAGITAGDSELATRVGVVENQNNLTPMSYNYVINGAFDIWQRGTTFSGSGTRYCTDRWKIGRPTQVTGATASKSDDVPVGVGVYNSIKIQRDSGNTDTNSLSLTQNFETAGLELRGRTVTFSFWAKTGSNWSGETLSVSIVSSSVSPDSATYASGGLFLSGNADRNVAIQDIAVPTSNWQRFSYTGQISSLANAFQVAIVGSVSGTAGADDSFYVTGVQLEEGSYATPFRRNSSSIQAELAACQRYYCRINSQTVGTGLGYGICVGTSNTYTTVHFPVPMRVAPVLDGFSNLIVTDRANYDLAVTGFSTTQRYINQYSMHANTTHNSGGAGTRFHHLAMNNVNGYIAFSAEL